ncbi:hypothetical protein KSP39_PZI019121 [Platanthera zijinensis]|uniref:Uncharacterized protein n=1 Tax=Platanthera zijinensis TaxID=2320716 RepID=A0AAP0B2M5_9ASPA
MDSSVGNLQSEICNLIENRCSLHSVVDQRFFCMALERFLMLWMKRKLHATAQYRWLRKDVSKWCSELVFENESTHDGRSGMATFCSVGTHRNVEYRVTEESLMDRLNTDMHAACRAIDKDCSDQSSGDVDHERHGRFRLEGLEGAGVVENTRSDSGVPIYQMGSLALEGSLLLVLQRKKELGR